MHNLIIVNIIIKLKRLFVTQNHPLFKGQNVASEQLQTIPAPTFGISSLATAFHLKKKKGQLQLSASLWSIFLYFLSLAKKELPKQSVLVLHERSLNYWALLLSKRSDPFRVPVLKMISRNWRTLFPLFKLCKKTIFLVKKNSFFGCQGFCSKIMQKAYRKNWNTKNNLLWF